MHPAQQAMVTHSFGGKRRNQLLWGVPSTSCRLRGHRRAAPKRCPGLAHQVPPGCPTHAHQVPPSCPMQAGHLRLSFHGAQQPLF